MPETKSTPGPWQKITSRLQMLILARMERKSCAGTSYDVCEVTDEEIIKVIEKNLDTKYAAAPDMLEALECAEDCRAIEHERIKVGMPMSRDLIWNLRQKWTERHWEIFKSSSPADGPINFFEIIELSDELRRRAIAKAKGGSQ